MKTAPLFLTVLLVAGCLGAPGTPEPTPLPTHATDCRAATNATTCQSSTSRTPLVVTVEPTGNRSRAGFALTNNGTETLRFDADPPAFWVYARRAGYVAPVAFDAGGADAGRALAPGANASIVLHYGKPLPESRARDVGTAEPYAPEPWPSGTYRACWSAHPGASTEWVRGCKDFRVR